MFASLRSFKKGCQCFFNVKEKHHDLAKVESDHNLSSDTFIGDYPTRWRSVHKIVTRILEKIMAVHLVLSCLVFPAILYDVASYIYF